MNDILTQTLFGALGDNVKLYRRPELPKVEFTKDKVTYKFTNLKYLNEAAVQSFLNILNAIIKYPEVIDEREITFGVNGVDDETTEIISDIVTSIDFEAKKKGRNGYKVSGAFLCTGVMRSKDKITFTFNKDTAQTIHDYCKGKKDVSIDELVVAVANAEITAMAEQWG